MQQKPFDGLLEVKLMPGGSIETEEKPSSGVFRMYHSGWAMKIEGVDLFAVSGGKRQCSPEPHVLSFVDWPFASAEPADWNYRVYSKGVRQRSGIGELYAATVRHPGGFVASGGSRAGPAE